MTYPVMEFEGTWEEAQQLSRRPSNRGPYSGSTRFIGFRLPDAEPGVGGSPVPECPGVARRTAGPQTEFCSFLAGTGT